MEIMNKVAYQELRQAAMPEVQAQVVAAHLPDWSQFATKEDISALRVEFGRLENRMENQMTGLENRMENQMTGLENRIENRMARMENRLIRWMVGIFLTFFALLGGSVTVVLNLTAVLNALRGF